MKEWFETTGEDHRRDKVIAPVKGVFFKGGTCAGQTGHLRGSRGSGVDPFLQIRFRPYFKKSTYFLIE
jgi:hypothetical protein